MLTVWKTNLGEFTIDLWIDSTTYKKANGEKKSKAFFFRLIELLSVGNLDVGLLEKVEEAYLKEMSFAFARANGFSELYNPKDGKPFYNSFRNAIRIKRSKEVERKWQNAVEKWKDGFMQDLSTAMKKYEEVLEGNSQVAKKSAQLGWFFSPEVIFKLGFKSSKILSSENIFKRVSKTFSNTDIKKISESWLNNRYFSHRKKIIASVIDAYLKDELELAIYGLIPQTEGVIWDFLVRVNPMEGEMEELIKFQNKKFVTVESVMRTIVNMVSGDDKIPFYKWVKFAEYEDDDHVLNRHAIEHGISMSFGTKENFFKLFFFLDFLHFVLSKTRNRTKEDFEEVRRMSSITGNVKEMLKELPEDVRLVAAAKTRTPEEVDEAIRAGVEIIGENYVQESEKVFPFVKEKAEWHFIGHLQKNKINKVIRIFDMVETIDSFEIAKELDKRCAKMGRIMPILIEINSGKEPQKSGVMPEDVEKVAKEVSTLENVRILGLMTMGPRTGNPEESRPYFKITKKIFDDIKKMNLPNVEMRYLSMGMSNSYKIAIEEGSNVVRIGTKIFGTRDYQK